MSSENIQGVPRKMIWNIYFKSSSKREEYLFLDWIEVFQRVEFFFSEIEFIDTYFLQFLR